MSVCLCVNLFSIYMHEFLFYAHKKWILIIDIIKYNEINRCQ